MAKYRKPGTATQTKRPDPVEQEDAFVAKAVEITSWAQRNQRLAVLGVGALVIGVAAFLYYGNFQDNLSQQAASQLEVIQRRIDAETGPGPYRTCRCISSVSAPHRWPEKPGSPLLRSPPNWGDPTEAASILQPVADDVTEPWAPGGCPPRRHL